MYESGWNTNFPIEKDAQLLKIGQLQKDWENKIEENRATQWSN